MALSTTPPPAERYADVATFGFYLKWPEGNDRHRDSISEIASDHKNYIELNLSPQQITMAEPAATAITFTQGGGKFIESRGGLVKQVSISGTTGFLPPQRNGRAPSASATRSGSLVDMSLEAEVNRAERSGFKAFYALRDLFRMFLDERRLGVQVEMHWMDWKGDDFWLIEPQSFTMRLSSRKPFLYEYEIQFTCLEPSERGIYTDWGFKASSLSWTDRTNAAFDRGVSAVTGGFSAIAGTASQWLAGGIGALVNSVPIASYRTATRRITEMIRNGQGAVYLLSGTVATAINVVLSDAQQVVDAYDSLTLTTKAGHSSVVSASKRFEESILVAWDVMKTFYSNDELSEGVLAEYNEMLLDFRVLNAFMRSGPLGSGASDAQRASSDVASFTESRSGGSRSDLIPETGTPLASNPFTGSLDPDFGALSGASSFRSEVVYRGETIYDVAKRTLGSIHRAPDIVFYNDLTFPFIVDVASHKPPGTVAWGEYIKIPLPTSQGGSGASTGPSTPPIPVFGGEVSSVGTSTEVICSNLAAPWRDGQWVGHTVTITSGSGAADPTRIVVSNTSDTLVVSRAWTISPTIGDSFTVSLLEFKIRIPATPEQIAFGRDLLLKWYRKDGTTTYSPWKATLLFNARGDLATVSGMENFHQVLYFMFALSRGQHPFHPDRGMGFPIGRPLTTAISPLYTFHARQELLKDPRVAVVKKPKIGFSGGAFSFQAEVQPINAHEAKRVNLGGG